MAKSKPARVEQDQQQLIRTLDGVEIPVPIRRVAVSSVTHFEVHTWGAMTFTAETPCGNVIDTAIGFCLSKPPCLKEIDAERFAAMYLDLKMFMLQECSGAELPIKQLRWLLEEWVLSQFEEGKSAILPHFALAAAEVLRKLLLGHRAMTPERWELDSLRRYEAPEDLTVGKFDGSFKRRFTELCRREFIGRVPSSVSLRRPRGASLFSEGMRSSLRWSVVTSAIPSVIISL
jgi:hypothetical protein